VLPVDADIIVYLLVFGDHTSARANVNAVISGSIGNAVMHTTRMRRVRL